MKKLITKLALFIIIALMANSFIAFAETRYDPKNTAPVEIEDNNIPGNNTSANPTTAIQEMVNDLKRYIPCISEDDQKGYIITIMEESFGKERGGDTDDFKTRSCSRNTIIYRYGESTGNSGKIGNASVLLKTCDEEGMKESLGNNATKISVSCDEVMVIYSKGGTTMIEGYISTIYNWAAGLVGLIAVLVIVLSGLQIAVGGGDSQAMESAKNRIIKSLSGLAVLFLSALILYTINPTFFTLKDLP
jgi:hypothetical protein